VGKTVEVGVPLARIEGEGGSEAEAALGETPAPATESPAPKPAVAAKGNGAPAKSNGGGGARYSPVVSRMAAEHGIDLSQIEGTGRGGRVRKQDVLAFMEGGGATAEEPPLHIESPYRPDEPEPAATPGRRLSADSREMSPTASTEGLSRMRRQIGAHMKRSLEIAATCTTWIEVDFARIEAARKQLGVTALPIVARCVIDALKLYPALNAWMEGEKYSRFDDSVNLGIAVSLGEDGLIVPVVHDAQDLAPEGLAKRIRDLAKRARSKQLVPDDVAGATFTITNPGQYGSIMATPIINQPQVAILDLEAVVKRPVVVGGDSIAIRPMTYLCMSWDHRALDGAYAAQFLSAVRQRIEAWT
jgi:2-oxoglutarate dehydrogenase E2 component (dihydrolipoamide succinyltransferase)